MKRLIPLLLCLVFSVSGCWSAKSIKVNTQMLNLRAIVSFNDVDYEGIFKNDSDGNCEFTFLSPQSLNGFSLCLNNKKVFIKYNGISYPLPQSDQENALFLAEISEIINSIPHRCEIPYMNEKIIYDDHCNGRAFELIFAADGNPVSLSVKSLDLTVKFYKY